MKRFTLAGQPQVSLASGVADAAVPALTADWLRRHPAPVTFLLDRSLPAAEQWAEDLGFFLSLNAPLPEGVLRLFPHLTAEDEGNDPRIFEILCDRLSVLTALLEVKSGRRSPLIIATTPEALLGSVPPPAALDSRQLRLTAGEARPFASIVDFLARELDYDAEAVCEQPGQFAVRGGLLDVYPLNDIRPYRLDFFGDEIESIRAFDPATQRSEETVPQILVAGSGTGAPAGVPGALLHYLPGEVNWILRQPDVLERDFPALFQEPEKIRAVQPSLFLLPARPGLLHDRWFGLTDIDPGDTAFGQPPDRVNFESEPLSQYRRLTDDEIIGADRLESEQAARADFLARLLVWQRAGEAVWVLAHNDGEENRLREILAADPTLRDLRPRFLRGSLHEGFRLPFGPGGAEPRLHFPGLESATGFVLVTDSEIFGRYRRRLARLRTRRLPVRSQVDQLLDFSELADGDPIVHLQHGIGLYRGLSRLQHRGAPTEVITLEFAEGARLHVPFQESHLLTRYVGLTKSEPKLARLGSGSWEKARAAAERATLDFAAELLNLQARRESAPGYAFRADHPWLHEFEDAFIYQETPDQLAAIRATRADMALPRPMDRLICGDVGFGKTEVALRAAFQAVLDGKQVAVLVPTTVLCQQHFNTFRERLADYPVVVEMVSRFRSPQQNAQVLAQLRAGHIDILIGTHRLLSEDVSFRDLGLLVIDEEQRFGVKQKERLKEIRATVDILTLSATPIPRTLYLALVGAREMSVIETPPRDRLPIQTIVKRYEPDLIRRAIEQEIARGGQVFYLHNRVQTIHKVAARLEEWFPRLRVAIGHGQMDEGALEQVMTDFVAGQFDVLVCTTIIESGIDIPNCNTMIIEGADKFGLAQLYQLRGRVGRFKRQAYCYLLLHQQTHIADLARRRLASLRQYNQLGAGYRIAMRDLELRGAGNLLGAEQSGHIAGVGFDLYCQLLRQSIARLKGDPGADFIRCTLRLDFLTFGEEVLAAPDGSSSPAPAGLLPADDPADRARALRDRGGFSVLKSDELEDERIPGVFATIPRDYLDEPRLRIDFFRQLAFARDEPEVWRIADALADRFGPYPPPVEALLFATAIRCLGERRGLSLVETEGSRLKLKIARAKSETFVKIGARFPRLNSRQPIPRLQEILQYLQQLPNP